MDVYFFELVLLRKDPFFSPGLDMLKSLLLEGSMVLLEGMLVLEVLFLLERRR